MRSSLHAAVGVAFLTGISGLAMLGQDILIANYFPVGPVVDAYQLAASFPLLLVNVLAGGTVLAVLVPAFLRDAPEPAESDVTNIIHYARRALGTLLAVTALSWAVVYPSLASSAATGLHNGAPPISTYLVWLTAPLLYFSGLASIDTAYLNSRGRFFIASTFPAFMPLGAITFTLLFSNTFGISATAAGLLCGSICQWLLCRYLTQSQLTRHRPRAKPQHAGTLTRAYFFNLFSSASLGGIVLTDVFIASTQLPGDLATYNYASRPVMLLLAFFTASIGNVIFPTFARLVVSERWREVRRHTLFWAGAVLAISFVTVAVWVPNCERIVAMLYQRGAFQFADTQKVAAVQEIYLFQVPFYLLAVIGVRLLNSLERHNILALVNSVAFVTNLVVDLLLAPTRGLAGLAIGTNVAFAVWACLVFAFALRSLHIRRPPLSNHIIDAGS